MRQYTTQQTKLKTKHLYPLLTIKDRLLTWQKAKGMWKNKPNAITELKKIRKGWTRTSTPLLKI
ncbi:hypothetical protein KAJ61_03255 [Candidatus Parcubacteria bacterium]|nr:hypothetical protein [Candidatus Parcubacteria bacterium]